MFEGNPVFEMFSLVSAVRGMEGALTPKPAAIPTTPPTPAVAATQAASDAAAVPETSPAPLAGTRIA